MFTKSQVILDTSLAELYAREHREGDPPTTLVPCYWCSDLDYTDSIPKTSEYLYQGTPPPNNPKATRRLVVQCLILEPQRFAFVAGRMEAALFDIGADTGRLDAIKAFSVLPIACRPRVLFVKGIEDLMYKRSRAQLAVVVPHEKLASHPQTVDPDVLYNLLSKRGLALSGLPTPQTAILDLDNLPGSVDQKLMKALPWTHSFALPRVFKTQQGMSSVGTFLVRTEKERGNLVTLLLKDILRSTLESVNIKNAHLYPSSLISQEMITQTQESFAIAFFVPRNGEANFLGACHQDMDSASNAWMGATIVYPDQDRLRRMLGPVVSQIAQYLHKEGYYGPAGADIMLSDISSTQSPKYWIIDLNVRMTGSLTLSFLRGHFLKKRGLCAASITQHFQFPYNREQFGEIFATEMATGRLIIVAWFYDATSESSWGTLIAGSEEERGVEGVYGKSQGTRHLSVLLFRVRDVKRIAEF